MSAHVPATDPDARYTHPAYPGVAFWLDGPEEVDDEDTGWSGYRVPTGRVLAVMVGDDHRHSFDPDDLTELPELDYCAECGQIGCTADGRDRTAAEAIRQLDELGY